MAIESLEFHPGPSYFPEARQHQKKHSAYQGAWRHSEIARWLGKAISFGGLLKAVDIESPPPIHENGQPPDTTSTKDPVLDYPKQGLDQIINRNDKFILQATGVTTDLNRPYQTSPADMSQIQQSR